MRTNIFGKLLVVFILFLIISPLVVNYNVVVQDPTGQRSEKEGARPKRVFLDKQRAIKLATLYARKAQKDLQQHNKVYALYDKQNKQWIVSFQMDPMPPGGFFRVIVDARTGTVLQLVPGK